MKILFIEADNYLDNQQEEFYFKLKHDGSDVKLLTGCYDRMSLLKHLLVDFKPQIIIIQTTFVYSDKFVAFDPLYKLINHPIEIWYMGANSAAQLKPYFPEYVLPFITFYDIWTEAYGDPLIESTHFKKLIQ